MWFCLFENHDPGYIHRAVQNHILITENIKGLLFDKEIYMPGIGRADIVELSSMKMWEIKHGGSSLESYTAGISAASSQLDRYIDSGSAYIKGDANRFNGSFIIAQESSLYLVHYSTPERGVVIYTFERTRERSPNPDYVYVPHSLYEKPKYSFDSYGFIFLGFGACGLGMELEYYD
jgi:hypothetical protein